MRDNHNSANQNPPYFKLLVSTNGLFVYIIGLHLPHFLYKRVVLSCVPQSCLRFSGSAVVRDFTSPLLFPNKPAFADEMGTFFYFKDNTILLIFVNLVSEEWFLIVLIRISHITDEFEQFFIYTY